MDILIIDPIHIDMVQQTSTKTSHATMMAVKEKTWSYAKWAPGDDFIPLALKYMGVFIFVLIHSLSFMHRPLSCIIIGLF